jgi:hypothetical protein
MPKKMNLQERRSSNLKGHLTTDRLREKLQVELKTISKTNTIAKRNNRCNTSNHLKAPEEAETCRKTKTSTTLQIKIWV